MASLPLSQNLPYLFVFCTLSFLLLDPTYAHSHASLQNKTFPPNNGKLLGQMQLLHKPTVHQTTNSSKTSSVKSENDPTQDDTVYEAEVAAEQTLQKEKQIAKVATLLQQIRHLHQKLSSERNKNEKVTSQFQNSLKMLADTSSKRAHAQKSLNRIDEKLKEYRRQAPLYQRSIEILHRQAGAAILEINRLKTSKYAVMYEKAQLQQHFRQRGLEAWVQNYVKDSVNPLVAGAVVEGTADVVAPMLDGIETLAAVKEDIAKKMANQIRESVPLVEKPFYSGFVTYAVLLFPLVLVASVLMKIKRSLTKLSAGHVVILGNFYFTLLSGGCFIATLLGSVDVLITFRHANLGLFDLAMVIHGLLYMVHVVLHLLMARRVRQKALVIHTVLLVLVGAHFFIHSYLHAMRNEDPHVDKSAYAIYTGMFAYVLYDWTVRHIRMSVETTTMKLNNKSISTIECPADELMTARSSVSAHQHFPNESRLASFSVSHGSCTRSKSHVEGASRGESHIENSFFTTPTVPRWTGPSVELAQTMMVDLRASVNPGANDAKDL